MDKIIKKISLVLMLFSVCFLAACSSDEKPTIEITLENPLRTTIEVEFIVTDKDDVLGNLVAEIYEKGEKTYLSRKTISLSSDGTTDTDVTFTGLEVESTYDIVFTGTMDKKAVELKKLTLTTSKNGSEEVPNLVSTFDDLKKVKNDADGYHILKNNIDCGGSELPVFFNSSKSFTGDFDGGNFTISNFKQTGYDAHAGVFGYIGEAGSVYDLKIDDFSIESDRYTEVWMGGLAGFNLGEINNVHLSNYTLKTLGSSSGAQNLGSFVGVNKNTGTITNCSVSGVVIDSNIPASLRAGGFVGANQSDSGVSAPSITNCTATNVLLDLMIDAEPDFSVNDDDQNIVLHIGGFIGENKGNITNSTAIVKIFTYVQNTKTDKDVNPDDFKEGDTGTDGNGDGTDTDKDDTTTPGTRSGNKVLKEYNAHKKIDTIKANVGGFVGTSTSGLITDCGVNVSLILEISYLDQLNAGGFVGYNGSSSLIKQSAVCSAGFELTFNEKTDISTTVDGVDKSLLGNIVGINNNTGGSGLDVYSLNPIPFTMRYRKADFTFEDFTPSDNLDKLNGLFNDNIVGESGLLAAGFKEPFIGLISTKYSK